MKSTYNEVERAVILQFRNCLSVHIASPRDVGLCAYLDDTVLSENPLLRKDSPLHISKLFKEWPEYSGNSHFPVPAPDSYVGYRPQDIYFDLPRNKGEYGEARIRLAKYLIKRINSYFSEGMHIPAYMIEPNTVVNVFYKLVVDNKGRYYLDLFGSAKRIPATKRLFVRHMENQNERIS